MRLGIGRQESHKFTTEHIYYPPVGLSFHSFPPSHILQLENGLDLQSPLASHRNGHIPNGVRNGSLAALRVPAHGGFRNSSGVAFAVHGRSEFDTDADVDIATMAAQRDQLRGTRNVRGMMAPVMSKEVSEEGLAFVVSRKVIVFKAKTNVIHILHSTPKEKKTGVSEFYIAER